MKLSDIIALFTLCVMTKAAWLAAVVQPVILGFGAVLAAFDLDILDSLPFITYITIVDNPAFLKQNPKTPKPQNPMVCSWAVIRR